MTMHNYDETSVERGPKNVDVDFQVRQYALRRDHTIAQGVLNLSNCLTVGDALAEKSQAQAAQVVNQAYGIVPQPRAMEAPVYPAQYALNSEPVTAIPTEAPHQILNTAVQASTVGHNTPLDLEYLRQQVDLAREKTGAQ